MTPPIVHLFERFEDNLLIMRVAIPNLESAAVGTTCYL